ncbi:MAG: hypothetical protein RLZZ299_2578 [Pseudomonadota bacterium]|jgi:hypothetical protein
MSRWDVWQGEARVLVVEEGPGALISTAPRRPGHPAPRHPFLSATALDAASEATLRDTLDAASDLADFLARLRDQGFRVTEAP